MQWRSHLGNKSNTKTECRSSVSPVLTNMQNMEEAENPTKSRHYFIINYHGKISCKVSLWSRLARWDGPWTTWRFRERSIKYTSASFPIGCSSCWYVTCIKLWWEHVSHVFTFLKKFKLWVLGLDVCAVGRNPLLIGIGIFVIHVDIAFVQVVLVNIKAHMVLVLSVVNVGSGKWSNVFDKIPYLNKDKSTISIHTCQ